MNDPPIEVRPVTTGQSARVAIVGAGAVLVVLVVLVLAGRLGGQASGRPGADASVGPGPSAASAGPVAAAVLATPVPRPSRLTPFSILDGAGGPVIFVSPNLGFSGPLFHDIMPTGYWDEGGPPAEAGGFLVFSVASDSGSLGDAEISVAVGSQRDPAPVRIPADSGPITPVWQPTLVALVQEFGSLLGGDLGRLTPLSLDGERAFLFEHPRGAAAVVLAVHHGRVYVVSSLASSLTRGSSLRAFTEFLAAFRFVDASAHP